ncbi:Cof-type HAD-IIB family hydrolase [Nonlabens ponticola]|uniref:HAD family phosphatase n=1 Tax=Nonlabens ponticola TaxID=2496866 RepID=A0A3S9MUK5_9FLAO|nr:Cof-type HAD-IIB family hydrolase [Nonlabens ponticola]AZQ42833.1 HAD family phosphatase [Nonlabens ponticola]
MVKLIATDIDGTLLDDNRFISQKTRSIFSQLEIPVILISARMPSAMYYLQDALGRSGAPIICYNGALIKHQGHELYSLTIPFAIIKEVAQIGVAHNLHVSIYRDDEWFVTQVDKWTAREINNTRVQPIVQDLAMTLAQLERTQGAGGAHKIMYMGDKDDMDSAFAKANKALSKKLHLYRSKDTYTEISPAGISKSSALQLLLSTNFKRISIREVAAFGDNYNDIEMLRDAGYGVAVENARPEVKAVANDVTLHHKKDGVALWLEDNLLQ